MNVQTLQQWAAVVALLSVEDEETLREATADLSAVEEALRLAKDRQAVASRNAAASREANASAQRWLSSRPTDGAGFEERHSSAEDRSSGFASDAPEEESEVRSAASRLSVRATILAFLSVVGEATRQEVRAEVSKLRPDVNVANCDRDLSRLLKAGLITRPGSGRYRLVAKESPTQ
ncbi:hypothetical protein ACF1BN_36780 [Streptomyces sp. NPDC014861]|uniref:hypothetical protein n=1 Tax=Streptomyces sp. NPDC014861 TaxID=3364923 RepID=UPI0036F7A488